MTAKEYNSWNYSAEWNNQKSVNQKIAIFYGSDLALSLSLSRVNSFEFWSEEAIKKNFTQLISSGLFLSAPKTVRAIISDKTDSWLLQMSQKYVFHHQCFLVIDGKTSLPKKMQDKKLENAKNLEEEGVRDQKIAKEVVFVKCDKLNSRSRKWFLDFHCKKLEVENIGLEWVNNLDELRYAKTLQKLGFEKYMLAIEGEKPDIWSQMRIDQFRKKAPITGLCKHFETWARNNSPGDEFIEFGYDLAIQEAEKAIQSSSKG